LEKAKIDTEQELVKKRKRRRRRIFLLVDLCISLTVLAVILILLFHKPAAYKPAVPSETGEVNKYWTNVLYPQIYNGAQQQKPFDVAVEEGGFNQLVADSGWPKFSQGAVISKPQVNFSPDGIALMGTVTIEGMDLVVTIKGKPVIDANGLLNLNVDAFKVGALNVTLLARTVARKMYSDQLSAGSGDPENLNIQMIDSILNNEPFEPVIPIEDKKIKIVGVTYEQGKLTIKFIGAGKSRR
jgi:hypothetical protein